MRIYDKPACILSDNGTGFTIRAILEWAGRNGVPSRLIDPGKPRRNAVVESFDVSPRPSRDHASHDPAGQRATL